MMHVDPCPYAPPAHQPYELAPTLKLLLLQRALATLDEAVRLLQQEAERQRASTQEAS
jgi:hypothetical protein